LSNKHRISSKIDFQPRGWEYIKLGIITSFAIALHEIPQEIGDLAYFFIQDLVDKKLSFLISYFTINERKIKVICINNRSSFAFFLRYNFEGQESYG